MRKWKWFSWDMIIKRALFFLYTLASLRLVTSTIALDSDLGICQGEVYQVTKTLPLYGSDYLLKGNLIPSAFVQKPTACTLMLDKRSTKFVCSGTRWGAIVGGNVSNKMQKNTKYLGTEVILMKLNRANVPFGVHLFCFTPHIHLRQRRSTRSSFTPTVERKQTEETIVRPAIKVNPLGHVILTSGALFSQAMAPTGPVRIQFYRFRIVDIAIGLMERCNTSENGVETWSKVHEFTGHEVLGRKIRYVANVLQPEKFHPNLKDTIILKVIHLTNTKDQVILVLPVTFVRIELTLTRNEPLTILQMHRLSAVAAPPRGNCITRWNLQVESLPTQSPQNIFYTITKVTKHGHIFLLNGANDKVYLGLGSVFRQSDVDAGQLFYKFRRVINDWSEATLRIERGLIYVKDKFHFRIHVHSYRPKKEHVFGIDILESNGETKTLPYMLNLPLTFRKQVGFVNKCGILTIQPPLIEIRERDCLKISTVQLKTPPMFEYIIEILTQPQSGRVYIVQPDRKCAIDTTFLPVGLLPKGMLIYASDGSRRPTDEFKFRVFCQDTRGLFDSVTDHQVPANLLMLKQMIRETPPIGSPVTETFHIHVQADEHIPPLIGLRVEDGRLIVRAPGNVSPPQSHLVLACPQAQSAGDCSGGYFTEQEKGTVLTTIALSLTSLQAYDAVPQLSGRFCFHCYVSDGVASFYQKIPATFSKLVLDLQKEVTITSVLNGTAYIFFKVAFNADVGPESIALRVVRAPVSGCLLLDGHAVDEFDYSAILRYRISYWQCKSLHDRMFSFFNLTELRDASLLNSSLVVENFDALTLELAIASPQGVSWGGRVDVKVSLTMGDLTALKNITFPSSATLPLIQVKPNLLSVQLVNPRPRQFLQIRISHGPFQLRDMLPLETMERVDAFYKVLSVPCRGKIVMSVSQFRVENVLLFSVSDLREGRVYYIPSTKCKNETDNDLNLLQQATDSRGSIHEQQLTLRISISHKRQAISFRNLTIGVGERVPLKKSNLHIIEVDDEGRISPILRCDTFSNETLSESTKEWLLYDEVFVVEEPPTCGRVLSKRLNRSIGLFSLKNIKDDDVYFQHNGMETCNFASLTLSARIRGSVETRVPRQVMVFFVVVRGMPVHLIRLQPPHMWWSSVVAISSTHLAAQKTVAPEEHENTDYPQIRFKVGHTHGGVLSASVDEKVSINAFKNDDLTQGCVAFHHDGSSLKAGFAFTLVYGDYESNVHQFNINVKVIKNISFVARTIVGFTDSAAEVSMSNINTVIRLEDNSAFNLIRACDYGGLHVLFTIMNSQMPTCYLGRRKSSANTSATVRINSFFQCDIYHGQIQLTCSSVTSKRVVFYLKGQLLDSISATFNRIIHVSEPIKLNVIIRDRESADFGEIVSVGPGHSQGLQLTNARLVDDDGNPYQVKDDTVFVLKSQPICGGVFCEHKKVQIGDKICQSPVYRLTGCSGYLDTLTLGVLPKAGGISSSTILTMPIIVRRNNWSFKTMDWSKVGVMKSVQIALNEAWIPLSSKYLPNIDGAMYTLLAFPTYGGIFLGDTQINSFRAFHLDQSTVLYRRNDKHALENLQDNFHLVICSDWPECLFNVQIIHVQIEIFPVERRTLFQDLLYTPSKLSVVVAYGQSQQIFGRFHLTMKPIFGVLMLDDVEILQMDSKLLSQKRILYYRSEWNTSMDEFALEQAQPPTIVVFRVITKPLIQFKTLYITQGKEFVLDARLLDYSTLQISTERLKTEGVLKTTSSLKKALHFEFPHETPVGRFFKSSFNEDEAVILRFTHKELLEGGVKFKAFPNISIQTIVDDIRVNVFASMFMAPQQVSIKIVIISGQYNIQNNILLSDFVDESNSVHLQSDTPLNTPPPRESESLKIWFATAIGVVCGIVCVLVTIVYFLLRRWRSKQRMRTQFLPTQIMQMDPGLPKSTHGLHSTEQLPIALSAFEREKALPQTNSSSSTEIASSDPDALWSRQKSRWNAPSPTPCFFHASPAIQLDNECRQSNRCIGPKL